MLTLAVAAGYFGNGLLGLPINVRPARVSVAMQTKQVKERAQIRRGPVAHLSGRRFIWPGARTNGKWTGSRRVRWSARTLLAATKIRQRACATNLEKKCRGA